MKLGKEQFESGKKGKTMKNWPKNIVSFALMLCLAAGAAAAPAGGGNGAAAFSRMKELVGTWELQGGGPLKATTTFELTSGGSTLLERFELFQNGQKLEEMVTIYFLDGDQVRLTHYCAGGNQPNLVGAYAADSNTLTFNFVSATSLKSPNDSHMHHLVIQFLDKDHFHSAWTSQKDQKDSGTHEMTFARTR
jgi:hypothetical protein